MLQDLKMVLEESFRPKCENGLSSIIGIDVHKVSDGYKLEQCQLIDSIIQKSWNGTPSAKTPLLAKCNLKALPETSPTVRPKEFIGIIGALSYVATGTRKEISFAVNLLARHAKWPGNKHRKCLQHLQGYFFPLTIYAYAFVLKMLSPCWMLGLIQAGVENSHDQPMGIWLNWQGAVSLGVPRD
ncbi:hypothetical protein O181_024941 [Austropuccinia psidii MF-1]|uniref:Reverse transcriptase Ty1/copia-type domain-containing protein n=1 Tax=Austropuccinia psidii MF-1 TaxID=1389203 RepID=A0A9Q3CMF4_9BASI|nr:hypothetical protein [Austropuccinia psidii MF-1]